MADTYQRSAGVQAAYGYRQLPSTGAAGGPDLKTVVCVGVGVFLGILVGTTLADGSWRSLNPLAQRHSSQISSSTPGTANRPVAKTAQIPPVQPAAVKQVIQQPPVNQLLATKQAPTAATVPTTHKVSVSPKTSVSRKHRLIHRVAAWRRHSARHRTRTRHRLHIAQKKPITAKLPSAIPEIKSAETPRPAAIKFPSAFTVQGEVTVASYDALSGTIDTYEGETFALDKSANVSGTVAWDEVISNIHYTCDQFWSCTLTREGGIVATAKRTR